MEERGQDRLLSACGDLVKYGKIHVIKKDQDGNPRRDVVYKLYDERSKLLKSSTTGSAGSAYFEDLELDKTYILEEVEPAGYHCTNMTVSRKWRSK